MIKAKVTRRMEEDSKEVFCCMWVLGENDDEVVYTIVYRGGDPGVRTYYKGHLDPRAGDEDKMPRFSNPAWALDWMRANRGEKCMVTVSAASVIRPDTYAEPV